MLVALEGKKSQENVTGFKSQFTHSEEATKRSVMEKDERVLPSRRGLSHLSFCCWFP